MVYPQESEANPYDVQGIEGLGGYFYAEFGILKNPSQILRGSKPDTGRAVMNTQSEAGRSLDGTVT